MSSEACKEAVEMPALGRPFQLGTLYNCISDQVVTEFHLWDEEDFDPLNDVTSSDHPYTEPGYLLADSLSAVSEALGLDKCTQLGVVTGMIDKLGGSAKVLLNCGYQESAAIHMACCHYRTRIKTISPGVLQKVKRPIHCGPATHVVTQVEFGTYGFFTFANPSDNVNTQLAKKLFGVLQGGVEGDNDSLTDFSFTGDVRLDGQLNTFRDAKVFYYQQLVKMDKDVDGKPLGVPIRVWLYPLVLLDEKAAAVGAHVHDSLVDRCIQLVGRYGDLRREANRLLNEPMAARLAPFHRKIDTFVGLLSSFIQRLQDDLAEMIKSVRRGEDHDGMMLGNMVHRVQSQMFLLNSDRLRDWLRDKVCELTTAKGLLSVFQKCRRVSLLPSREQLLVGNAQNVTFAAVVTFLDYEEHLLCQMQCVSGDGLLDWDALFSTDSLLSKQLPWYKQREKIVKFAKELDMFKRCSGRIRNHSGRKATFAVITSAEAGVEGSQFGVPVVTYECGQLGEENVPIEQLLAQSGLLVSFKNWITGLLPKPS